MFSLAIPCSSVAMASTDEHMALCFITVSLNGTCIIVDCGFLLLPLLLRKAMVMQNPGEKNKN
jgi:hypothetical protein